MKAFERFYEVTQQELLEDVLRRINATQTIATQAINTLGKDTFNTQYDN